MDGSQLSIGDTILKLTYLDTVGLTNAECIKALNLNGTIATSIDNESTIVVIDMEALSLRPDSFFEEFIYPNPSLGGVFNISKKIQKCPYSIKNSNGQSIKKGVTEDLLDLSEFESGIYFIEYKYFDRLVHSKLIITH